MKFSCSAVPPAQVSTCSDGRRPSLESSYPGLCAMVEWVEQQQVHCVQGHWDIDLLLQQPDSFDHRCPVLSISTRIPLLSCPVLPRQFGRVLATYARENTALLTVFLNQPFTQILGVNEDTSVIDAISSIGGLLGLFMGFTAVTTAEFLYFGASLVATSLMGVVMAGSMGKRDRRRVRDIQVALVDNQ